MRYAARNSTGLGGLKKDLLKYKIVTASKFHY